MQGGLWLRDARAGYRKLMNPNDGARTKGLKMTHARVQLMETAIERVKPHLKKKLWNPSA